mmetsp:Transcript_5095/g.8246  ORF Transcript_5095/g.8246 Transcript_5095/m.8246 type:complete len:349 (-) Transcript_5095:561-1607(-)
MFIQGLLPQEVRAVGGSSPYLALDSCATPPDALQREGHVGTAVVSPTEVEAILFRLAQLFLVLRLIGLPTFLDQPKDFQSDILIVVAKPCEEVWEDVRFMIHLIWTSEEPEGEGLEPKSSHSRVSVEAQRGHVVHIGHGLVERFDGNLVRVVPGHEDLKDLEVVLPNATPEQSRQSPQSSDTNLRMVVHEAGEDRPAHWQSKVQQHLRVVVAEGDHGLAGQGLHLMIGVHGLCSQKPCRFIDVRVDLRRIASCQEGGHKVAQIEANFLTFLHWARDLCWLLLGVRAHHLWQVRDAVEVFRAKAGHKRGENVRQHAREIGRVLNQTAQNLDCQLSDFFRFVLHPLQQGL